MSKRIKGITVEIGGDVTGLNKSLSDVDKSIKNTQNDLKDVNRLLKLDPANTELLQQKQKLLAEAVGDTKTRLDALKEAEKQAQEQFKQGNISEQQYDALKREIVDTEQKLKSLEKQARNTGDAFTETLSKAGGALTKAGDKVEGIGKKFAPVSAAVAGLGAGAVATAANFESSMSQVQATMGITKDAMSEVDGQSVNTMDTLSELAKTMGSETAFSAAECADALNYLALAGYDTQQMTDTLPTVLNLAAAGSLDLASASDMVTDAMSALGMSVDESEMMVDQMAKTASTTNTSVAQLGEGILTIGATAKDVKGGTAELSAALGILANNGIKGAEGGTHLRNIILSLQNPTEKAAKVMEQLGVDTYDTEGNMRSMNDILGDLNTIMDGMTSQEKADIINRIFNKTDLSSVNALLANTGETWDGLQQSIVDSGGAAQQMADTQLDNLQGQITILKSAIEGLAISFGELLMPMIKSVVEWVQGFIDKLNSLDEGTKNAIVTIGLIVAAIGPVLIVIGKVMGAIGTIMTTVSSLTKAIKVAKTAFAALNTTMLANPIGIVIAAVAALVAALIYLWNTNEDFRDGVIKIWEKIKEVFAAIGNWFKELFTEKIPGAIQEGIEWIQSLGDRIKRVFTEDIPNFIKSVIKWFEELPYNLGLLLGQAIGHVINFGAKAIEWVKTEVPKIIEGIIRFFAELPGKLWEKLLEAIGKIKEWGQNVINWVKTEVPKIIEGIIKFYAELPGKLWDKLLQAIEKIKEWGSNVLDWAKNTIPNIISTIVDFFSDLPGNLLEIGKDMITGLWDGIKSMAEWLASRITDFFSGIVDGVRDVLDINSPSRVFANIGEDMALGTGVGFSGEMRDVTKDINSAMRKSIEGARLTAITSGGGSIFNRSTNTTHNASPIVINMNNTFTNYKPQDGAAAVRDLNRQLGRAMS